MLYNHITMKKSGLDERSKTLRRSVIDMLKSSHRGHPGSALSAIEILRVLYDKILQIKPNDPNNPKRDRFILSKGHASLALYAILSDKKFFPKTELLKFCKIDGILGGHPDRNIPGVEMSTGSLGHGLPTGVGMAINARMKKLNYRVFVMVGDGECDEGSIWESMLIAGKHHLSNLTVIVDYNHLQSYDETRVVQDLEPFTDKWEAFGAEARETDGHDVDKLEKIFKSVPFNKNKPSVIICHTVKGKGIPVAENNPHWHHKRGIKDEEIQMMYQVLEEY